MVNDNIIGRQRPDGYGSWNSAMDQAAGVAPAEFGAYACNDEIVERFARSLGGEDIRPSMLIAPSRLGSGVLRAQIPDNLAFTVTNGTSPNVNGSTRVGPNGLIEVGRTNLALQSAAFNVSGTWIESNVTVTPNVTATLDPAGGNTADQIFEIAASGNHFIAQTMAITSGTTYAGSVFLKKASGSPDWMQIAYSTTGLAGFANFNLTSATVGNVGAGCTGRIESYGNGWYRCTLIQTATASGTSGGPVVVFTNNTNPATRYVNYTGNTTTSIYAWGAQLEIGSTATEYIPTTTVARTRFAGVDVNSNVNTNAPRLDYLGQSCPALLVEPSAQNLAFQSQAFDVSGNWTQANVTVTPNVTATLDPAGGNTADLLADSVTTGSVSHRIYTAPVPASAGSISVVSGTTYSTSLFVKAGTSSVLRIVLRRDNEAVIGIGDTIFNVTSGTITSGSGTIENYGNGWYRCTNIGTSNFTGGARIFINLYDTAGNQSYIGTAGTNNMYIWGAQLETGAVATTYIPTTTGAVTRNADQITASGALVSGLIGQSEGTIYLEFNVTAIGVEGYGIRLVASSFDNSVHIRRGSGNAIALELRSAGSSVFAQSLAITGFIKAAIAYKSGDIAAYINGTQVGTTSTYAFTFGSTFTSVNLGAFNSTTAFLNDRIRSAAIYTTRLSNEQLMLLTSPTYYGDIADMSWSYYLNRAGETVPSCLQTRNYQLLQV